MLVNSYRGHLILYIYIVLFGNYSYSHNLLSERPLKELDILTRQSSDDFYYFHDDDLGVGTYIPKNNNLFNTVKAGDQPDSSKEIWSTLDDQKYSYRVNVGNSYHLPGIDSVKIYPLHGKTIDFYHNEQGDTWFEHSKETVDGDLIDQHKPEELQIYTEGSQNPNDLSKYEVREITSHGESKKLMGYNYVFKEGAICEKISYENVLLWKHDYSAMGDNYPKRIFYTTIYGDTKLVIYINDGYITYRNKGGNWNMTDSLIPGKKKLEITELRSSSEFRFYKDEDNKTCVYLPNEGVILIRIDQNNEKIWEADQVPADYVMITNRGTEEEKVIIHLMNGEQKIIIPEKNVKQPSKIHDRIERKRTMNTVKFVLLGCALGITAIIAVYFKFKH